MKTDTAAIDEATETGTENEVVGEGDAMTTGRIAGETSLTIVEEADATTTDVAGKIVTSLRNKLEAVEVHHPRSASPPQILRTSPAFLIARDD